ERAEIEDVLTRFFRAFLAGRQGDLEYFVPAGVRIGAVGQPYELAGLDSVAQDGPAAGRVRSVLVTVRARDPEAGAVYPLRYRVRLVRRDRWYVAAVNATRKERWAVRKLVMLISWAGVVGLVVAAQALA